MKIKLALALSITFLFSSYANLQASSSQPENTLQPNNSDQGQEDPTAKIGKLQIENMFLKFKTQELEGENTILRTKISELVNLLDELKKSIPHITLSSSK